MACENAAMSQMKDQLKDDLTAAMKSRDELTAATLRMALTAITNEEVSGKEARSLSDDDIIGLEIPNGVPIVYELDAAFRPVSRRFLASD